MKFDYIIETKLQTEQLWTLFDQAFTDSKESPLWPNELEWLSAGGLREGEAVAAAYHDPISGSRTEHHGYTLRDVTEGQRFSYEVTPEHPLEGGATVEFIATPTGARIRWHGAYQVPFRVDSLIAAAFLKLYFERRFFAALARNIQRVEQDLVRAA